MWKILKYKFPIKEEFELELPSIHKILKIGMENDTPCMWIVVGPTAIKVKRKFRMFRTGHEIPGGPMLDDRSRKSISVQQPEGGYIKYLDTFYQRAFVWHLFEVIKKVE